MRFYSQVPDRYFWTVGCADGTVQNFDACPLRFADLVIRDTRPGNTGEININEMPWHLVSKDLASFAGLTFDDPEMQYLWTGPGTKK